MRLTNALPIAALLCLLPLVPSSATPRRAPVQLRYLHTNGSQIVNVRGQQVTLAGINWYGMETSQFAPQGLDQRALDDLIAQTKSLGFNTIRLPYSDQIFEAGSTPTGINYELNPQLAGLTSLQIMDAVVDSARRHGMWVILDRHRPDSSGQSALWYTTAVPESVWLADLTALAQRYLAVDTVVGIDLHNEPHDPATWGSGDVTTDWRLAAERGGNAVLAVNPQLLIFVEGIQSFQGNYYWWGGNLMGAQQYPVQLNVANRLVYEAHDYPSSVSPQTWFNSTNYPANLPYVWDQFWGYLVAQGQPVILGEFGSLMLTDSDQQWIATLVTYLNQNQISSLYWCLNPTSADTGGILNNDWTTLVATRINAITPLLTAAGPILPAVPRNLPPPGKTPKDLPPFVPAPKTPPARHDVAKLRAPAADRASKPVMSFSMEPEHPLAATNPATIATRQALYREAPSPAVAHFSVRPVVSPNTSAWWGELGLTIENAHPLTALHATVTVHRTPGVKAAGQYNTFWGGTMQQGVENADGTITYSYSMPATSGGVPNGRWMLAAQFNGNGTPRLTAEDHWRVEAVSNGETQVLAGHF